MVFLMSRALKVFYFKQLMRMSCLGGNNKSLLVNEGIVMNYFFVSIIFFDSTSAMSSNGIMSSPNPIDVLKTERSPTKICGHSDVISRTAHTNKNPPSTMSPIPKNLIFQLFMVLVVLCKGPFFSINEN